MTEPGYVLGGKGAGVDCSPGVLDATTYCTGYCTWYAYTRRPDVNLQGLGNANAWLAGARVRGIPTGKTPTAGAIAVWSASSYPPVGHVAYVERVEGANVVLAEMNFVGWNKVSSRILTPKNVQPEGYIYGGPGGNGSSTAGPTGGLLIGAVRTDGTFQAKQGISGGWVTEDGAISAIALSGDYIAALSTDGTMHAKQGLFGGWVTMQGSVSKIAVADTANGPIFGAVLTDGTFQAKQGISGGWVTEDGAISAIAFGGLS